MIDCSIKTDYQAEENEEDLTIDGKFALFHIHVSH